MANWKKFIRTDGQSTDVQSVVTLPPTAFAFNAQFIRTNKLGEYTRITVFCDAARYRVGMLFHTDASDQDSFALTADGGRKGCDSRAVQVNALMKQHHWLSVAARSPSPAARRYRPIWLPADGLWVINIRPSFETRVASSQAVQAGLCGIYRYWAGDQIVYIGRGDIRSRANSAARVDWVIDAIEFSVVDDTHDQEKWEALWLDEHRNQFGSLPLYNRIGGKRPADEIAT